MVHRFWKKARKSVGQFAKREHLAKRGFDAALGYAAGGPAGAAAMSGSGLYGRGLYGRGAYLDDDEDVVGNTLMAGGMPGMQMGSGNTDNQETIISHTEYLQDVYGPATSAFNNQSIAINPGLLENFPWLSQLACNFEEYEFIQLVFEYRTTVDASATNNTSGATGTIVMCTNYNPDAGKFISKEAMMQYHGAVSGRVTDGLVHGVECDPSKNAGSAVRYTRTSPPVGNQSLKDFDLGKFQFGVVNIPAGFQNQQIGELWVTYTVRIQKPRLFVSLGRQIPLDRFVTPKDWLVPGAAVPLTAVTTADLMKNNYNSTGIAVSLTPNGVNGQDFRFTFPSFTTNAFEIKLYIYGSGLSSFLALDFLTQGTVAGNFQFLGTEAGAGNPPWYWIQADNNTQAILTSTLYVAPATEGVDNVYGFTLRDLNATPGLISQMFIMIQQTNTQVQLPLDFTDANGNTVSW